MNPSPAVTAQILANLPDRPLETLRQADALWSALRSGSRPVVPVVGTSEDPLDHTQWDVIIAGGTLGIFMGAALAQRGWRVAVVERGILRGRVQEWNISRAELEVLVRLGLLTEEELGRAIVTEYNPGRISFASGQLSAQPSAPHPSQGAIPEDSPQPGAVPPGEIWVRDVLNLGVDPVYLLDRLKAKFLAAGGHLLEQTPFQKVTIHPNGVAVQLGAGAKDPSPQEAQNPAPPCLTARLLLDAMGHFSPIAHQARQGQKPDAVCLVVGTCAQGFPPNPTGDLFAAFTPITQGCQYFWEAFPAQDGRTTYLFTYGDAHPDRPSLEQLFEEYFRLLPAYQGVPLEQLQFRRALFGVLPSYRQSPLQTPWDRVLAVGDSSGNQSPLSFGGFGSLLRHLERLDNGLDLALQRNCLRREDLHLLQPYQPSLSVTWLFQRSMSVPLGQTLPPDRITRLLGAVFQTMDRSGESVLKPFMQDVVQFFPLAQTMLKVGLQNPLLVPQILPQIGLMTFLDWCRHYFNLAAYTALYPLARSLAPIIHPQLAPQGRYRYSQWVQALKFGSGQDYHL